MFTGKSVSLQMCILVLSNLLGIAACGFCAAADAAQQADLFEMPIEDLTQMSYTVYGASRYKQTTAEAPSSVTVISADEIRKYGYRTLADILRSVKGFYTTYDRNYQYLGVRGFGRPGDYNSRILLLVDGYRANDNIYGSVYIDRASVVDVDLIERVEIIRGPGSSLYGSNAFFAVVNVITRQGADVNGIEMSGEFARYDTYQGRATYGAKLDKGPDVLVSFSNYDSDGQNLYYREFDDPSTNNGVAEDADTENFNNLFTKLAYGDFAFEAARTSREKRIPTASWETVFNDNGTKTRDTLALFTLMYEHDFKDVVAVMSRLFYGCYDYDGDYIYAGPYINEDYVHGKWFGGEIQFTKTLAERHKLIWGLDYQDDQKQQQGNYDIGGVWLDDTREGERWGLYVQDEFRVLDNVTLNLGVRHDDYSTFGGTTTPRLGVIYNPFEKTTVKLLYGEAFRAPSPYELYYNDGGNDTQKANPGLNPETITTYELVLEQALTPALRASVSGFVYEIEDLISLGTDPSDDLLVFNNSEKIKARGLEFELDGKWENGWQSRLSYTLVDTEDSTTGEHLTNSPQNLVKANLVVPLLERRLFAGIETQYESKRMTVGGNYTDDFIVANLTLTYRNLIEGLEISASVYNVFDKDYGHPASEEHTQDIIAQDGTIYRIKLTYRF